MFSRTSLFEGDRLLFILDELIILKWDGDSSNILCLLEPDIDLFDYLIRLPEGLWIERLYLSREEKVPSSYLSCYWVKVGIDSSNV